MPQENSFKNTIFSYLHPWSSDAVLFWVLLSIRYDNIKWPKEIPHAADTKSTEGQKQNKKKAF